MSKAVSALGGEVREGFATVSDVGLRGMITVRGDHGAVDLKNAVTGVAGVDFPGQRQCNVVGDRGIAWMSPDELLVMVPYQEVSAAVETMTATLGDSFAMAVDVSDARAVFRVEGKGAREVLAKLSPVDLSPEAFGAGMIRRSRLSQVPAAFWMVGEDAFEVVCFRSVARYVFDILGDAAASGGEVGYF